MKVNGWNHESSLGEDSTIQCGHLLALGPFWGQESAGVGPTPCGAFPISQCWCPDRRHDSGSRKRGCAEGSEWWLRPLSRVTSVSSALARSVASGSKVLRVAGLVQVAGRLGAKASARSVVCWLVFLPSRWNGSALRPRAHPDTYYRGQVGR